MARHVALLGDSIFDNGAYTGAEPDVITHLRSLLPPDWRASLFAVDGSTTGHLPAQFPQVTADVTHLVISLGGNDALLNTDLLSQRVSSASGAFALFREPLGRFESAYRAVIDGALALGRETTICTIYDGNFEAEQAAVLRVGLMMFNDVILRVGFERRLPIIDLRLICTEPEDYANPIEPSGRGGRKIAEAITRTLGVVDGDRGHSRVYGR